MQKSREVFVAKPAGGLIFRELAFRPWSIPFGMVSSVVLL